MFATGDGSPVIIRILLRRATGSCLTAVTFFLTGTSLTKGEESGMLGETLDPHFEAALRAITMLDWNGAREILAQRLDNVDTLGRRRLNLYLLSAVATSTGHRDTGEQLAQMARAVPIELNEPRYLGQPDDDTLHQIELGWWTFNGWNGASTTPVPSEIKSPEELPWADILDSALEGRAGELERRWSSMLESERPERAMLWNLIALAYLEKGDPRTYDEMRSQAPEPTTPPAPLIALLKKARLVAAVDALEEGRWLTADLLEVEQCATQPETAWNNGRSPAESVEPSAGFSDSGMEEFWDCFQTTLERLREKNPSAVKPCLRELLGFPFTTEDTTHAFLVSLLFAGAAIMEGDTIGAQESIDDAVRQAQAGTLNESVLGLAQERARTVGALTIADKLCLEGILTLDPWHDFPADF